MLTEAVPEIHVLHAVAAREFYSGKLGFTCVDSWRADNNKDDPCFMTLDRDDARLYVTSFKDGALGTSVYIFVDDVDALYAEFDSGVHIRIRDLAILMSNPLVR